MAALDNVFGSMDGVTSQIGFGQVPGFEALQRPASRIGFGSALGSGQQMGSTPIGQGSVPGGIRGDARNIGGYDDFLHGTYGSYLQGIQDEWNSLMGEMPGGAGFGGVGSVTALGGDWATVDQWDQYVVEASRQFGIPGNLLKAIMRLESGGDPRSTSVAGAVGLMQVMPQYWGNVGYDIYSTRGNVMAGAYALKSFYDQWSPWAAQNGMDPWEAATRAYLAGSPYSQGSDAYGTNSNEYWGVVNGYLGELGGMGTAGAVDTGSATGNSVVQMAMQYVGKVPYVWGGIPGKGQTPYDDGGGWDCSGFTFWLDQNYGGGQLPAGSHYQYQWAADTGQLFTNQQQLQPGDLVFFNTGNFAGGGAHLNAAGHVGVYIGNGKMLHAANPSQGTIVSDFAAYTQMYQYLGGLHMAWSGGGAGVPGQGGGGGGYAQPMSQNQLILSLMLGRPTPGYTS